MPVMDGLQATRLIRSYEKTGNWDEAKLAGVEPQDISSGDQVLKVPRRRIPIIAVSTWTPEGILDIELILTRF